MSDLDIKDGHYIAYRLKTDVEDLMDEDGSEAMSWNVVVPSFVDDEEEIGDEGDPADEDEMDDIETPVPRNAVAR